MHALPLAYVGIWNVARIPLFWKPDCRFEMSRDAWTLTSCQRLAQARNALYRHLKCFRFAEHVHCFVCLAATPGSVTNKILGSLRNFEANAGRYPRGHAGHGQASRSDHIKAVERSHMSSLLPPHFLVLVSLPLPLTVIMRFSILAVVAFAGAAVAQFPFTALNVTALVGKNNASAFECWSLIPGFLISNQTGTAGAIKLELGNLSNGSYSILPPGFNGGLHNAPANQCVSGSASYTISWNVCADMFPT